MMPRLNTWWKASSNCKYTVAKHLVSTSKFNSIRDDPASFKRHRCGAEDHSSKRSLELQDTSPRTKLYNDAERNVEHPLSKNASPPLWHFGLVHAGEVNLYLTDFFDT